MFEARVRLVQKDVVRQDQEATIGDPRHTFWQEIYREARSSGRWFDRLVPDDPAKYEAKLKEQFPSIVQKRLIELAQTSFSGISAADTAVAPETAYSAPVKTEAREISVFVKRVEYGSIEILLEIFGLSGDDGHRFLLDALKAYSAIAFNEAMGVNVALEPSVELFEVGGSGQMPAGDLSKQEKLQDEIKKRWFIANTSLVVPVLIGMGICYYLYTGILREVEALRTERKELRTEHAEIIKALADQNAKLSATLVDHAKSSVAGSKMLEELIIKIATKITDKDPSSECCKTDCCKTKTGPDNSPTDSHRSESRSCDIVILELETPRKKVGQKSRPAHPAQKSGPEQHRKYCPMPAN